LNLQLLLLLLLLLMGAGLKYWSEHPTRHHDPTTVCDVVGHEGATDCETLKLYTEDWKWRRYRTVTNIRSVHTCHKYNK
jgi:hypothetical protein